MSFSVDTTNGDVVSILYNGAQLQDSSKFTQIASGFGSATVTSSTVSNNIAVIAASSSAIGGDITQYYIVRSGVNNLYMATYADAEPSVGELRLVARLSRSTVPNSITGADVKGGTAIEGSDGEYLTSCDPEHRLLLSGSAVFSVNGQTRSKFYSSIRHIEDQVHGVTGSGVGVYMVIPGTGYERSSGGPFFRGAILRCPCHVHCLSSFRHQQSRYRSARALLLHELRSRADRGVPHRPLRSVRDGLHDGLRTTGHPGYVFHGRAWAEGLRRIQRTRQGLWYLCRRVVRTRCYHRLRELCRTVLG